ncbi:MAG: XdhC family protein [Sphingomonadales bacterium]
MKQATLDRLIECRAAKTPVVLATHLGSGAETLYHPLKDERLQLDGADLTAEAAAALRSDRGRPIETPTGTVFLNVFNPPLRMLVIGAVHITQPLVRMAELAGFDVTVIDPRTAFATTERFPGIKLRHDWPDEALEQLKPDARTAVVTLTHDPKIDDPALIAALRSDVFYIGALGSRRTHGKRLERLGEAGFDALTLERIHAPIGLSIHAKSPAEIAVSIMAQVVETLRDDPTT